jgi:hypothetical protein
MTNVSPLTGAAAVELFAEFAEFAVFELGSDVVAFGLFAEGSSQAARKTVSDRIRKSNFDISSP